MAVFQPQLMKVLMRNSF